MQWLLLFILVPYLYLLLKTFVGLIKIRPYHPSGTPGVFLSVIVACRNEEKNIAALLSDIVAQTYNNDLFELIIVDDNSSDRTSDFLSEFREVKNLRVLKNTGSGKKSAIKTGVEACRGTIIVTTDADCRIGKEWLITIASFFSDHNPEMIICPVKMEGGRGFFQRFQELEFLSLQGVTAGTAVAGKPVMCNGANLVFTKDSYLKNSGNLHFELASGDDVFLLHSIMKGPGKILWLESENAVVTTRCSQVSGSFLNQRARWVSKSGAYNDRYTQMLAIITFVTILLEWFLLIAGIFNSVFLLVLLAVFLLKSLPDFLILRNTAIRYKKKKLLWFFLPGQLIYPFYVISVLIYYFLTKSEYQNLTKLSDY
jgi:glycosyltransferase involved in cell wall biosynthesis